MGEVFIRHTMEKSIFQSHFKNFSPELIMIFLSLPGLAWANFFAYHHQIYWGKCGTDLGSNPFQNVGLGLPSDLSHQLLCSTTYCQNISILPKGGQIGGTLGVEPLFIQKISSGGKVFVF